MPICEICKEVETVGKRKYCDECKQRRSEERAIERIEKRKEKYRQQKEEKNKRLKQQLEVECPFLNSETDVEDLTLDQMLKVLNVYYVNTLTEKQLRSKVGSVRSVLRTNLEE